MSFNDDVRFPKGTNGSLNLTEQCVIAWHDEVLANGKLNGLQTDYQPISLFVDFCLIRTEVALNRIEQLIKPLFRRQAFFFSLFVTGSPVQGGDLPTHDLDVCLLGLDL